MANTHKLKGWNPGFEPEVYVDHYKYEKAYVVYDHLTYIIPKHWLEPLGDNDSGARSTESDEQ